MRPSPRCRFAVFVLAGLVLAASAHASRYQDFEKLKSEGKLSEALQVLREEFADPSFVLSRGSQPVIIRGHFLFTLGEHAWLVGVNPETDAEALKVYSEGLAKFAGDDGERQAYMHNGMAVYYSRTRRNGLALPYLRKELVHWEREKNDFRLMLTLSAIGSAYWDMGEFEMSAHYNRQAIKHASGHFVLGERPRDINQWAQYDVILSGHMDQASQLSDLDSLERLWKLREPIGRTYWKLGSLTNFVAAQHFAIAGAHERARTVLDEGRRLWQKERDIFNNERIRKGGDTGLICSEAQLAQSLGDYKAALQGWQKCIDGTMAMGGAREDDANFERKRGYALEQTGALDDASASYRLAIASSEKIRSSFTVAERAKFFRTVSRDSYWGLVRIAAKRAAEGNVNAFFEALHTSELVRGRQLGEQIDANMSARIAPESLRALQKRIPPDTVVLAYTATASEMITLAVQRDSVHAYITPYDERAYAALARRTAAALASPDSNRVAIDAQLLELSKPVLFPVRALLAGKKRIVALPDGVMNIVPFELFSAADDAYRPLLDAFVVSSAPSIAFTEFADRSVRSGRPANLFAIGDPSYVPPKALGGASVAEISAATRGSRFLSYFQRLPETRTEVEAIARAFPGEKTSLLLGDAALESKVKTADLREFGFIHFATHGVLGGEVPGIGEPALVLGNEPGEDGFLTATEVRALKLSAEIAVLSACNTGSGEVVTGEGVMGISRAFLVAGSRSVLVSLWPVASKQTERLMVDFYTHLRSGKFAAEALRTAKLDMIAKAKTGNTIEAHPFFWAPFILLGG